MRLLASIFKMLVAFKNYLYEKKILKSYKVDCWVISVGNITVGGTGKTPVVDYLIKNLRLKGHKVAVISRGYKSKGSGIRKVNPLIENAAAIYGDEPTWIAQKNEGISVYISPDRVKGIKKIVADERPDIVIADDAFQHRRLQRNIDIVVIDATEKKENYLPLPKGRSRESFDSLARASAVFITKTNLVGADVLRWVKGNVRFNKNLFEFEIKLKRIYNLLDPEIVRNDFDEVVLVSGIGKPDNFEKILEKFKIREHLKFKDHVDYTEDKLNQILDFQRHYPVLTTEKDAVKLKGINCNNLWVCELEYSLKNGFEKIYELIRPSTY